MKKRILSLVMAAAMCLSLLPTAALADLADDGYEPLVKSSVITTFTTQKTVTAGKYYLSCAIKTQYPILIEGDVTLDLNGFGIMPAASDAVTVAMNLIQIKDGATLTLTDSSTEGSSGGYLSGTEDVGLSGSSREAKISQAIVKVEKGGTFVLGSSRVQLKNCTVSGDAGGVYVDGGAFTMKSGTITGCAGNSTGGVYVGNGGTFTMSGGSVTNCTGNENAGGVYVTGTGSEFTMSGGSVSDCGTTTYDYEVGGSYDTTIAKTVRIDSGATLAVNGGASIGSGKSGDVNDSLYNLINHGTMNVNGGTVTGGVVGSGKLTVTGGSVTNGVASQDTVTVNGGEITGNVNADGMILQKGTITGNVTVSDDLTISGGKITGKVNCTGKSSMNTMDMTDGTIEGGLEIAGSAFIHGGTISGGVTNKSILLIESGTVNGGLINSGAVSAEGGTVNGDVTNNADSYIWMTSGFKFNGTHFTGTLTNHGVLRIAQTEGLTVSSSSTKSVYQVTFETDYGNAIPTQYVSDGWDAGDPGTPLNASSGYTFEYWYLNDENTKFDFENTKITRDIKLTALWTERTRSSLTFDYNGGTKDGAASSEDSYFSDETITYPTDITRVGYTFLGWGTGAASGVNAPTTMGEHTRLYAQWAPITYTIKLELDADDATLVGDGASATINCAYDKAFTLPAAKRPGYKFKGWSDGGDKTYNANENYKNLANTQDTTVTLTAQWEKVNCSNHMDEDGDGECDTCFEKLVVKLTDSNGDSTWYTDFVEAYEAASEGSTLTLLRDVTLPTASGQNYVLQNENTMTVALNGKTLSASQSPHAMAIAPTDADITIQGPGTVQSAVIPKGSSKLTLTGGVTVKAIQFSDSASHLIVKDANVKSLNVSRQSVEMLDVQFCGGTFDEITTTAKDGLTAVTFEEMLAEGYGYKYNNTGAGWLTQFASASIAKNLKVEEAPIKSVTTSQNSPAYGSAVELNIETVTGKDGSPITEGLTYTWALKNADDNWIDTVENTADSAAAFQGGVGLEVGTYSYRCQIHVADGTTEGYTKTVLFTVTVDPLDLADAIITVNKTFIYNGTAQAPNAEQLTVTVGRKTLTTSDFDLSCESKTDAGTGYSLTITGKGNYTGEAATTWSISRKEISVTIELTDGDGVYYTGSNVEPSFEVRNAEDNSKVDESEYTVTTTQVSQVGEQFKVEVKDTGIGNYFFADASRQWTIQAKPLESGMFTVTGDTYTGGTITAAVVGTFNGMTLAEGTDYELSGITSATNAGTYKLTITGKGNYSGTLTDVEWTIDPKSVDARVEVSGTYTFNGREIVPEAASVKVYDGETLISASEYTFTCANNTAAGTATVNLGDMEGGNYAISGSGTFEIGRLDITGADIEITLGEHRLTYTGEEQEQLIDSVMLGGLAVTYTVTGNTGTDAGDGYVLTITGTENFTGTATKTWSIAKAAQSMTAEDVSATYGDTDKRIQVEDSFGALSYEVTDGTDVVSVDADGKLTFYKAGDATVTISAAGDGNHNSGQTTASITVSKKSITIKALDRGAYIGGAELDLSKPKLGTDYEITGLVGKDALESGVTIALTCDADMNKTGQYDIILTVTGADSRYDFETENGTLTVSYYPVVPSAPTTVTVPVSSDHATVDVKAEVSKGNATVEVSDEQIEKVAADGAGTVTVDVSGLKDVESVTVPTHVVEKANDAEDTGLTVALPAGSVGLDEKALDSVTENADGKDVTISVESVSTSALPPAVKEVIGMEPTVLAVVDVNVTINGVKQSTFNGGKVTVSIPYTPKKGEDTSKLAVWFIRDDGKIEKKNGYYDAKNKCFVFETDHLSQYLLVNTNAKLTFTDVPADAFYADAVDWAVEHNITNGNGVDMFYPNENCTRAQIVTFLWRAAGCPDAKSASTFTDVPAGAYYADAVAWAVENGITDGIGGKFGPDLICTREQAVTFLYRAAGAPAVTTTASQFSDVPSGAYYADAVAWAAENGITGGIGGGKFAPKKECTRSEIVTMLYRYFEKQ